MAHPFPTSMRPLLSFAGPTVLGAALGLAACSGLPPEAPFPLERGEVAVGGTVTVDLSTLASPDASVWVGTGLGDDVDVSAGFGGGLFLVGGPAVLGVLAEGMLPEVALRKTFDNGVSVGIGTATRLDATEISRPPIDSLGTYGPLIAQTTVGPFVSVGTSRDAPVVARATLHAGYSAVRPVLTAARDAPTEPRAREGSGLSVHVSGLLGGRLVERDTLTVTAALRAQGGALLAPRPRPLLGPGLGLTVVAGDPRDRR